MGRQIGVYILRIVCSVFDLISAPLLITPPFFPTWVSECSLFVHFHHCFWSSSWSTPLTLFYMKNAKMKSHVMKPWSDLEPCHRVIMYLGSIFTTAMLRVLLDSVILNSFFFFYFNAIPIHFFNSQNDLDSIPMQCNASECKNGQIILNPIPIPMHQNYTDFISAFTRMISILKYKWLTGGHSFFFLFFFFFSLVGLCCTGFLK